MTENELAFKIFNMGEYGWKDEAERTEKMNEAVNLLEQHVAERCSFNRSPTPHKCPVCNGNGLVPNGFYNQVSGYWLTTSLEPEKCRSCDGSGVVWH